MKEGWEIKTIGELCNLMTGGTPSRSKPEYFTNGNIKWLVSGDIHKREIFDCDGRITEQGMAKSNVKYLPINSVMIALNGQGKTRGTVALLRTKATCNQSLVSIFPKDIKKILPEFIYCNLHGRYEEIRRITGDDEKDRRGLNMPLIRNIQIPLPPLPEQQRIVSILDEAFAAIAKAKANAEQNLRNAKELFESYLQGVFEAKGAGWEETLLAKEIDLLTGFPFKSKDYTDVVDDTLLLRGDNIMQGELRWEDAKRWKKSEYDNFKKYQMQENDIVLAMDRPWVKAGLKCARLSKNDLPALLVQRTACLRSKSKLDSSFLYYLVKSKGFTNHLIGVQTGIGVPHISGQQILDFAFNKPPISQQHSIVQKLDTLSAETKKLEAIYRQKISDLEELKKSILQKAFSGGLNCDSCD
jgi:type I restriction enzyme, S subunit